MGAREIALAITLSNWRKVMSESTVAYRREHVIDTVINDESMHNGRDITVHVDSLGMVSIEFGNSMTIRTDSHGLYELREALARASSRLLAVQGSEEDVIGWPS
jgi:hypothetical protein